MAQARTVWWPILARVLPIQPLYQTHYSPHTQRQDSDPVLWAHLLVRLGHHLHHLSMIARGNSRIEMVPCSILPHRVHA
jgi:hypothetical protein